MLTTQARDFAQITLSVFHGIILLNYGHEKFTENHDEEISGKQRTVAGVIFQVHHLQLQKWLVPSFLLPI